MERAPTPNCIGAHHQGEWYERILCRGSLADQPRPRAAVSHDLLNSRKSSHGAVAHRPGRNGRGSSRSLFRFRGGRCGCTSAKTASPAAGLNWRCLPELSSPDRPAWVPTVCPLRGGTETYAFFCHRTNLPVVTGTAAQPPAGRIRSGSVQRPTIPTPAIAVCSHRRETPPAGRKPRRRGLDHRAGGAGGADQFIGLRADKKGRICNTSIGSAIHR